MCTEESMTIFCHPLNLCNLDQSCLDNVSTTIWFLNVIFLRRDERTPRTTSFAFFACIWSAATENHFCRSHIFVSQSLFFSCSRSFFLSFIFRVTCRESFNLPVHFCTSIFAIWLSAHTVSTRSLITCLLVTNLYCLSLSLSLSLSLLSNHNANISLWAFY